MDMRSRKLESETETLRGLAPCLFESSNRLIVEPYIERTEGHRRSISRREGLRTRRAGWDSRKTTVAASSPPPPSQRKERNPIAQKQGAAHRLGCCCWTHAETRGPASAGSSSASGSPLPSDSTTSTTANARTQLRWKYVDPAGPLSRPFRHWQIDE